jgi:hypothetical protein
MAGPRRFVLTATVVWPGGTLAEGTPSRSGPAGPGSASLRVSHTPPATALKGTIAVLDPEGEAYAAIGGENLRPFTDGDHLGRAGLAN